MLGYLLLVGCKSMKSLNNFGALLKGEAFREFDSEYGRSRV